MCSCARRVRMISNTLDASEAYSGRCVGLGPAHGPAQAPPVQLEMGLCHGLCGRGRALSVADDGLHSAAARRATSPRARRYRGYCYTAIE